MGDQCCSSLIMVHTLCSAFHDNVTGTTVLGLPREDTVKSTGWHTVWKTHRKWRYIKNYEKQASLTNGICKTVHLAIFILQVSSLYLFELLLWNMNKWNLEEETLLWNKDKKQQLSGSCVLPGESSEQKSAVRVFQCQFQTSLPGTVKEEDTSS